MSKNVKLVALVGGEEVVVGRCHPGEARILRKQGLAEWKKNRLVLLGTLNREEVPNWREVDAVPEGWEPDGVYHKALELPGTWEQEAIEIDPERILSLGGRFVVGTWNREAIVPAEEFFCESLSEWVTKAQKAREAEHDLLLCDDPMRRMFGFLDEEEGVIYYCGLVKVKQGPREAQRMLRDARSRQEFLGQEEGPTPSDDETAQLEAIWQEELVEPLRKEWEAQLEVDLIEVWMLEDGPWDASRVQESLLESGSEGTEQVLLEAVAAALNCKWVRIRGASPKATAEMVKEARYLAAAVSPLGSYAKIVPDQGQPILASRVGSTVRFRDPILDDG